MIDMMFWLAVCAMGWGLSLATYAFFARLYDWPVGTLHLDLPIVPVLLGLLSAGIAVTFALTRDGDGTGFLIILFGVLLAVFWIGFVRVGSQISLILAPVAAAILYAYWHTLPAAY